MLQHQEWLLAIRVSSLLGSLGFCAVFACRLGTCWQPVAAAAAPAVSVRVTVGGNATLPCDFIAQRFSARDQLKVIWMRNTTTLTFNRESLRDRRRISVSAPESEPWGELRYNLVISGLRRADRGVYTCIASYLGEYHTRRVSLLVKVPPRIIAAASSPAHLVVAEGDPLALHCEADGLPKPSIAWLKRLDQPPFVGGLGRRTVALGIGPRYLVPNASRQCEGAFLCRAANGVEPQDTREIRVVVHYRPRVSVANEQISQSRGRSTMVMCAVSGLPMPEFYWEHRGRRFHPSAAVGGGLAACRRGRHCLHVASVDGARGLVQMDLLVSNLTAGDFGVYQCVARSALGEDRKAVHVLELQAGRLPEPIEPAPAEEAAAAPSLPNGSGGGGGGSGRGAAASNAEAAEPGARVNKHSSGSLVTSSASGGQLVSGVPSPAVAAASAAFAAQLLHLLR